MSGGSPVYLDHAATTPLDPAVLDAMLACFDPAAGYGNPSALHCPGRRAYASIETARADCAALINALPHELVFTSGATEADNLALLGAARFRAHRGRHLVTVASEHKAVLAAAAALEREGFEVTRLNPEPSGLLDLNALAAALRDDTQLVSVMAVNNETGVVQDLDAIGSVCRERDILFHTDAAQAAGKLELDVRRMPIDLLSMTAHKMHGPQGIGALFVAERRGCGVEPLMHGGGHERRLRPGTLPHALIVGFAAAARRALECREADCAAMQKLNRRLWDGIRDLPGVRRNGAEEHSFPGILNVSVAAIEGESLLLALEPVCVASGAACNSQSGEASPVLKAMGLNDFEAQGAIRFSFGRGTKVEDIDLAVERYRAAVTRLSALAAPRCAAL